MISFSSGIEPVLYTRPWGRLAGEDAGDGFSSHPQLLGDLAHGQALDFPEPPNLDLPCLVHRPEDKSLGRKKIFRLVSYPHSSGQKRRPINTLEQYLVLVSSPFEVRPG